MNLTSQQTNQNSTSARPSMSPQLFEQFSQYIYEISGIRFLESKAYFLSSKIQNRCNALNKKSFEEYLAFIKSPAGRATEHVHLLNEVTINETFFFRNEPQLASFEKNFLAPLLVKRRSQGIKRIRIWSCASSTGDEAYTTVLQLLNMEGSSDFRFEIIGTDICKDAIAKANAAEYKRYAIRNIPPAMLNKYFTKSADGMVYKLNDEIKKMVRFQECSLMDSARIRMLGKFDVAICRNVLIYFDNESKEAALQNIYNALADDGILIAGHSENLYGYSHLFRINREHSQAHAYSKAPPGTEKSKF